MVLSFCFVCIPPAVHFDEVHALMLGGRFPHISVVEPPSVSILQRVIRHLDIRDEQNSETHFNPEPCCPALLPLQWNNPRGPSRDIEASLFRFRRVRRRRRRRRQHRTDTTGRHLCTLRKPWDTSASPSSSFPSPSSATNTRQHHGFFPTGFAALRFVMQEGTKKRMRRIPITRGKQG